MCVCVFDVLSGVVCSAGVCLYVWVCVFLLCVLFCWQLTPEGFQTAMIKVSINKTGVINHFTS